MRLRPASGEHLFDAIEVDAARSCDELLAEMIAVVQPLDRDVLYVFDTSDIAPVTGHGREEYEGVKFMGYDLLPGEGHREELPGIYQEGLADDGMLRRALHNGKFVVRRQRPRYDVEWMLVCAAGGAENINVLVRELGGMAAIYSGGALYRASNGRELVAIPASVENGRYGGTS